MILMIQYEYSWKTIHYIFAISLTSYVSIVQCSLNVFLGFFFPLSFHETSARNKKFTVYLNLSEYILGYIVARKPDMLNYYGDINFYFSAS